MNDTNPGRDPTDHPYEIQVIRTIYAACLIVIFLFGLFGNVITIIVLQSTRLRQSSTAVYLTALAVVDLLYLLASPLVSIINTVSLFPGELRQLSAVACHWTPFLSYTFSYLSVWLMVTVTIDRAIWVTQPFKAKLLCTQRRSVVVVAALSVIFVGVSLHFHWTMTYSSTQNINRCKPNDFSGFIYTYVDFFLSCCLPFVIMLLANVFIIWQLRRMRKFTSPHQVATQARLLEQQAAADVRSPPDEYVEVSYCVTSANPCGPKERRKHGHQKPNDSIKIRSNVDRSSSLTTMLFGITLFFMISISPLMIYDITFFAIDLNWEHIADTQKTTTIVFAVEKTVYVFWYTNFAVHFYLYCLNGPPFRKNTLSLFKSVRSFACNCLRMSDKTHRNPQISIALDGGTDCGAAASQIRNTETANDGRTLKAARPMRSCQMRL